MNLLHQVLLNTLLIALEINTVVQSLMNAVFVMVQVLKITLIVMVTV